VTATPATPGVDQVAGYDKANRLASFQEGANSQTFGYDPPGSGWANRWVSLNSGSLPLNPYMPTTSGGYNAQNQLTAAQYGDGRGNLTGLGANGFGYDGENRLVSVQVGQNGVTYGFDGNGQRVTKTWGQQTTTYAYDAMGNLAAEYGSSATPPCTTCYVSVDQLGSTRVLTDAQGNVKERHDYMPFGDELLAGLDGRTTGQGYLNTGGTPGVNLLFTGQYRDRNGGASVTASSGLVYGLDGTNNGFSGPFKGGSFYAPTPIPFVGAGGSVVRSGGVTVVSAGASAALVGRYGFGLSVTNTTKPLNIGNVSGFSLGDFIGYLARRPCN
jgi:hypothetical protein